MDKRLIEKLTELKVSTDHVNKAANFWDFSICDNGIPLRIIKSQIKDIYSVEIRLNRDNINDFAKYVQKERYDYHLVNSSSQTYLKIPENRKNKINTTGEFEVLENSIKLIRGFKLDSKATICKRPKGKECNPKASDTQSFKSLITVNDKLRPGELNRRNFEFPTESKYNLPKAIEYNDRLYELLNKSDSFSEFHKKGNNLQSGTFLLRKIMDMFMMDVAHKCMGTFYRTRRFLYSDQNYFEYKGKYKARSGVIYMPIHCEHTIPVNILSKYLFYNLKDKLKTTAQLFNWVLKHLVVTVVTKIPENNSDYEALSINREFNGKNIKWAKDHPCFEFIQEKVICVDPFVKNDNKNSIENVTPFIRYYNPKEEKSLLEVYVLKNGEWKDINEFSSFKDYTLGNHYENTKEWREEIMKKIKNK